MNLANGTPATDKLLEQLKSLIASADQLVAASSDQPGHMLAEARAKTESVLRTVRTSVAEMEANARAIVASTEENIREHPWSAVSISAGIGLLIGVMIARK
jgi:ElaB/YqjD/DUF883 family membrane-anchored ribosome-binding protein